MKTKSVIVFKIFEGHFFSARHYGRGLTANIGIEDTTYKGKNIL